MKSLFILLLCMITFTTISAQGKPTPQAIPQGQTFDLDSKSSTVNPKDPETLKKNATLTTNNAIYKGATVPVYVSKAGKLFIIIKSKNDNWYRKYLTL